MNRERAETFLRLLAESKLRDPARLPLSGPPPAGAPFGMLPVALIRAAWALTTVGALDQETADSILADTELAVAARNRLEPPLAVTLSTGSPGPGSRCGPAGRRPAGRPRGPDPARAGRTGTSRSAS